MVTSKTIYPCEHHISELKLSNKTVDVVRGSSQEDAVLRNYNIVKIHFLYQLNVVSNTVKRYYENEDFYTNSTSVVWYEGKGPSQGESYYVEGIFNSKIVSSYAADTCPRCGGNGWFLSTFDEALPFRINLTQDSDKLVQEFIKILFTTQLDDGYGTNLQELAGRESYSEEELTTIISSIVSSAEEQYKKTQNESLYAGYYMTDHEKLDYVEVTSVEYNREDEIIYFDLLVKTMDGSVQELSLGV